MSQQGRARRFCISKDKLLSVRMKAQLARGYRAMSRINSNMAEEMLCIDNEALAQGEQKLTECEIK